MMDEVMIVVVSQPVSGGQTRDGGDHEQSQEDDEQRFRDARGRARHAVQTERARDECDDEEDG
jgi:hypothetical protein